MYRGFGQLYRHVKRRLLRYPRNISKPLLRIEKILKYKNVIIDTNSEILREWSSEFSYDITGNMTTTVFTH